MRTIKFRGRDTLGDWHYGVVSADGLHIVKAHHGSDGQTRELYQSVEPTTIGQYTGINDRHGKEIYEGDFLSSPYFTDGRGNIDPCTVAWSDDGWDCTTEFGEGATLCTAVSYGVEIVGNIHDSNNH